MDSKEIETRGRKILMAMGRALTDVNLYKKGHPTPTASLRDLTANVQSFLENELELNLFRDKNHFVANGQTLLKIDDAPAAVKIFFDRYKVHSLTFKRGLESRETEALHDLAEVKDLPADFDLGKFFSERQVTNVSANLAEYKLVDDESAAPAATTSTAEEDAAFAKQLETEESIESIVAMLAKKASSDPEQQKKIFEAVMNRLKLDIETRIDEATKVIKVEKKQVENERKRTESVIDMMTEGVVTVDANGKILMMDPTAEEFSGRRMSELAGKGLDEAANKENQIISLAKELSVTGTSDATGDVKVIGEGKLAQAMRASNILVRDQQGRVVGLMMTLPAAAKFRELERMQQEFVASITHELRAPLTSIISALSILEDQAASTLSKDQERVLGLASKNASRLADLVSEILDFQQIQTGHMKVHVSTTSSVDIVKEAVEALKPWAQTRGINLSWEVSAGAPPVAGDFRRTVQVITNLVSNAIKFTPTGGNIWVAAKKGTGPFEGSMYFTVKDTGRGIAKEDQEKIFEKFVQVAAEGRRVPGTGLGLAIAKYLVYLQKGKMGVESELGKGATFYFTLPIDIPPQAVALPAAASPKAAPTEKKPWWKRLFGG